MIATALAFVMVAQQAGSTVTAVYAEEPEFSLVYPDAIAPQIEAYYNCLRSGSYVIGNDEAFEAQHRKDIPRCNAKAQKLEAEANASLKSGGLDEAIPPSEVAEFFETVRQTHISRGAGLDRRVTLTVANSAGYSLDGSCAAGVQTLIDQRASYMQAEELRIEALVGKSDQTPEEQAALARYRDQLNRYNELITLERGECAAANEREAQQKSLESAQQTNAQD